MASGNLDSLCVSTMAGMLAISRALVGTPQIPWIWVFAPHVIGLPCAEAQFAQKIVVFIILLNFVARTQRSMTAPKSRPQATSQVLHPEVGESVAFTSMEDAGPTEKDCFSLDGGFTTSQVPFPSVNLEPELDDLKLPKAVECLD